MAPGPYADPDDLSPLSVAQLRAVCAVADRLSFTAAAHDLGLTQPAVSRLVTGAERRLGLTLFHRVHRAVTPSEDTGGVLRAIRSALAAHETVLHQARAVRRGESGTLRVGVLRGGSPAVLTDALIRFRAEWPESRLSLAEYRDDQLIEAVRDGQVDVVLARLAEAIPNTLRRRRLLREQLHALVPTGHPLAARSEITLADSPTSPPVRSRPRSPQERRSPFWRRRSPGSWTCEASRWCQWPSCSSSWWWCGAAVIIPPRCGVSSPPPTPRPRPGSAGDVQQVVAGVLVPLHADQVAGPCGLGEGQERVEAVALLAEVRPPLAQLVLEPAELGS
jgi:DNA-binding transcriptional LysR family regulator